MNPIALVFVMMAAFALLSVSRRMAPVPLLAGTCYMTLGQELALGPFHFTVIRILVAVGVVRVVVRREGLVGGMNALDWSILGWASWACASSVFHQNPGAALVFRLGLAYNACGLYFLLRIFCTTRSDVIRLCQSTAFVLTLVAFAMLYERASLHNLFSAFGGVPEAPEFREGRTRAFGPFAHPILAGTVGAVNLPLMIGIWRLHRKTAALGIWVCLTMIVASASSGPVLSMLFALGGLMLWRFRAHMRLFRWTAAAGLFALSLVMKAPIYYLIARIDIVGGSTGWHRSRLIESALEHLGEWWIAGTDYTRHWMGEGMLTDPTQVDITNHYLSMGVVGGLPLIICFIVVMSIAFSYVGTASRSVPGADRSQQFVVWALGCSLFAHAATFISVSYFDQSIVFLYLTLAAIGSAHAEVIVAAPAVSPISPAVSRSQLVAYRPGPRATTGKVPASSERPLQPAAVPFRRS